MNSKRKRPRKDNGRYLSQRAAGRKWGITVAAVNKAIATGKVGTANGKVDMLHPSSVAYGATQAQRQTLALIASERGAAGPRPGVGAYQDRISADLAKIERQIQRLELQNERSKIENAERRETLLPREQVRRVFSRLYSIQSTELLTIGDRISPEIAAVTGVENAETVIAVGRLIQSEIARALDNVDAAIRQYVESEAEADDTPGG